MTKVPKDQLASQDRRVIKGTRECRGLWDLKERKELPGHQGSKGQRVHLGLGVFQGLRGQEGQEVDLEVLVRKVTLGLQDFRVGMDNQGFQGLKGHRGPEEQQDLQVWKDHVGLLDPLVPLVLQDCQDCLTLHLKNQFHLGRLLNLITLWLLHPLNHLLNLLKPPNKFNPLNHPNPLNQLNPPNLQRNHKVMWLYRLRLP